MIGKDFLWLNALSVTKTKVSKHQRKQKHWPPAVARPIVIHHRTSDRKGIGALILAQYLKRQHSPVTTTATATSTTTTVLWPFVRDDPGEPVPEETFIHSHLSWSSIIFPLSSNKYDPQHPPCSIYMLDSLFPQSLSKSSLVYLLVWQTPLHTPYISSPNYFLLFAAHAHTIAACFAVVARLCHLILVYLSTLYLESYLSP